MLALVPINSPEAIQCRLAEGRIPLFGPMLMLFARPALLLVGQGITLLLFMQLSVPNPTVAVRNWSSVFGTLVDFGCLGLLRWLTRREGIRLRDLIGFVKRKLQTDIVLGLGIFIVGGVAILAGGMLAQLITYGHLNAVFPDFTYIRTLPLWAVLYSRILWWPLWSATEELTYNGYALPRLIALTNPPWLSVLIVSFFFSIQHSFLMLADFQFGLYMFLAFVPLTIVMELLCLRIRRLPPLIIAHWLMDLSNVLFLLQTG
jgi:CAAX prenyl protease-like protein